jgi:hypothetical protein
MAKQIETREVKIYRSPLDAPAAVEGYGGMCNGLKTSPTRGLRGAEVRNDVFITYRTAFFSSTAFRMVSEILWHESTA